MEPEKTPKRDNGLNYMLVGLLLAITGISLDVMTNHTVLQVLAVSASLVGLFLLGLGIGKRTNNK